MTQIETDALLQDAVLWTFVDMGKDGKPRVSAVPCGIKVRWIEDYQTQIGPDGTPISTNVTIVVDRDIPQDSALWKGKLSQLPANPTNIFSLVQLRKTTDIKNRNTRRVATLRRYGNQLPPTVS